MGNNTTKSKEQCSFLSSDEMSHTLKTFKMASKNGNSLKEDDLMKYWNSQIDSRLSSFISNYLYRTKGSQIAAIDFNRFVEMYALIVKRHVEDKVSVIFDSISITQENNEEMSYALIKEYVEAIVSSYFGILRTKSDKAYKSWEAKNYTTINENIVLLAENFLSDLLSIRESQMITKDEAEKWLQFNPTFLTILEEVFFYLYHSSTSEKEKNLHSLRAEKKILPICESISFSTKFNKNIDISQILFINSNLPVELQCKWRFLFSSQIHGESFSTFIGRIMNNGPNVVIIEDDDGYIFGGFASSGWAISPNYVGNESTFLFTLSPRMQSFTPTGYNNHYQYLNLHQQTMPNGLGMGGQYNYWGLWIDSEYGIGECSESCTTFKNYIQLSAKKKFKIRSIEVWAVGEIPATDDDEMTQQRSVLDGNLEDKVILELAGRQTYSDGLREEPE